MPDLDAVEPSGDQRLQLLPAASVSGMSPYRESARIVRDRDRVLDRKLFLRNEGATVAAKVSHERIAEVVHDSASYKCARDVRPTNSSAIGLQENFVERYRYSELVEFLDDLFRPAEARCAQIFQALVKRVELGEVE